MTVTDMHMILLRAHLDGEDEVASKAREQLTGPNPMDGLAELVNAAFAVAAQRKFSPTRSNAQIVRFVAHVRALLSDRAELLDPLAGELELRRALGEPIPASPNIGARAAAQLILLDATVQSLGLDDQAVWDLLHQARDNVQRHRNPVAADS
jgi:hypothetical protein